MAEEKQPSPEVLELVKKLNLDIKNINEDTLKVIERMAETQKNSVKYLEEQAEELSAMGDLYDDQVMKEQAKVKAAEAAKKKLEEDYITQKKILDTLDKNSKEYDKQALKVDEIKANTKEQNTNLEKANKELAKAVDSKKAMSDRIAEHIKKYQEVLGHLTTMKNSVMSIATSIDDMTGGFNFPEATLFSFDKLVATLKAAAQEVVKSLQTVTTSTGVVLSSHNQILNQGLGKYAIANKELAESFSNLYSNMNQFSNLNVKEQANLTASAAKMKNLGVDTKIYAQNLQLLNNSFGMTASTSNRTLEELAQKAREAGITPQKMFADLNTSMGSLAAYGGKKALEVFVEMQKQSKALGIEIGKLNGIVGNTWDTFEGAAQRAGGLNAILGGDFLNATQMLNATESQRVMLLKKSIEASGQNWQSMDKFQKLSIMNTLGIKDQAEAESLFGKSVSQTEDQMKKKVNTETTLAQAQLAGADAMRKLEFAQREQAAQMKDFVEKLQGAVKWLKELIRGNEKWIGGITIVVGLLAPVLTGILGLIALIKMFTATAPAAGAAGAGFGQSMRTAAPGILAVGAAVWLIGKGIAVAAEGMTTFINAFKGMSDADAKNAIEGMKTLGMIMGGLAIGVVLLGIAGKAAAPGILAVGAAVLLLGAGIGIAATGIGIAAAGFALLIQSIENLISKNVDMNKFADVMSTIVWSMIKLAAALYIFAPAGAAGAVGIAALGLAFVGLGFGVKLATDNLVELTKGEGAGAKLSQIAVGLRDLAGAMATFSLQGISGGVKGFFFGGLGDITNMVDGIIESVNKMPTDIDVRARAFAELGSSITNVSLISADSLKPANDFVNNVKTLYETQTKSANAQNDMFMAMIKGISKLGEKDKKEGEIEIVLRVDDQSFKGYIGASAVGSKLPKPS